MAFYTNFVSHKGHLLLREVRDGKRVRRKVKIKPTLYTPDKNGEYRDVHGTRMSPVKFNGTYEARKFVEDFSDVDGYSLGGMTSYVYPAVNEMYPGEIDFDVQSIVVACLDIEVAMKGAKPDVDTADQEVLSIAMDISGVMHVFSCLDYAGDQEFNYVKCDSERDLLDRFLSVWETSHVDVVTGWFIDMFDIPYLVNRIRRVLGDDDVSRLSPWGMVETRLVKQFNRENVTYDIIGVSVIDYMRAYKKFTYKEKESYRLDFIANEEKVGRKLDYSDIGNLNDLYTRDPTKFIDYNVMDVVLVKKLDDKLKLLELIYTVSYFCKITFDDAFGTVKMWEALIHNHLMKKRVVVPVKRSVHKRPFEGGYVKEPLLGKQRWVVSFDFDSLYPHIVMALNISTETIDGRLARHLTVDDFMEGRLDDVRPASDSSIAASGVTFSNAREGFFPEIMKSLYERRSDFKRQMIAAKKAKEVATTPEEKTAAERSVARLNALQLALKYALNSGYGAMSNEYFLWFDMNLAESITLSGQLAIKYTARGINRFLNWRFGTENVDYVVAIDTDSVYVTLDELVAREFPGRAREETLEFIDQFCEVAVGPVIKRTTDQLGKYLNARDPSKFNMKRETIADVGVWTAKKKYALRALDIEGVRLKEPEIKSTGLEVVKSSTPAVCRKELKAAIGLVMDGDESKLHDHVREFRKKFFEMRFEDTAFPRGVNDLEKYTERDGRPRLGCPQHTRAAITYNRMLDEKNLLGKYPRIESGDKIKFGHLRLPNASGSDVIACVDVLPEEFGLAGRVDYDLQFEKAFTQPLKLILDVVGWSHEKKPSMASFF